MPADPTYFPLKRVCAVEGQRDPMTYVRGDVVNNLVEVLKEARKEPFASGFDSHLNDKIDRVLAVLC